MTEYTIKALEDLVGEVARKTMTALVQDIAVVTPKLTGLATGNWEVTIGRPSNTTSENLDVSGGATINAAQSVILSTKNIKYPVMWLTNNQPYIVRLNDGWSKKAPAKFVETAMKRAVK